MDDIDRELECLQDSDDDSDISAKGRKKPRLSLGNPMPGETSRETGFHQSTRVCLEHIREAMLHHRWQEAAEYMAFYPQVLEDLDEGSTPKYKEIIWRLSTEILHHHPNSTLEDYNNIYERMKHAGVKHYLMISLEHAFHLLLHGHIEDAKLQFSACGSWRYGNNVAHYQATKLIQAYRSLLDYVTWCDKKHTHSYTVDQDDSVSREMSKYFRHASANLKEIVKYPGVWDPFILSYVEMLEFYEDYDTALKVLNDYAYDNSFPPNPNAHVYLYQYLKRRDASKKRLAKVLKILRALVPSHELMLEYSSLLLQSEKITDVHKALGIVLDMLDFACWRNNLDVWKRLKAVIQQLQCTEENWKTLVLDTMSGRKDWWPVLHFTSFHASKDSVNPELMEVKASLKRVLCPDTLLKYTAEGGTSTEWTLGGKRKH
ncbi:TATA box-binding protein-associated factor RNA polymerase I subunit A [Solea solea]|uniref:TATA box-binding protein-associated factor RNA polymerase I subunit A n=1 Tax=Solea solea TaxID=90069 RepID=UPI00272D8ABD|nr:TATA box-binding protein-associated factor RNA polymerase I subunit A [Solea solea]XP_058470086.1 TATA box-binding protein-associated factor RNA polymerase I subunit A [Solea solea]